MVVQSFLTVTRFLKKPASIINRLYHLSITVKIKGCQKKDAEPLFRFFK